MRVIKTSPQPELLKTEQGPVQKRTLAYSRAFLVFVLACIYGLELLHFVLIPHSVSPDSGQLVHSQHGGLEAVLAKADGLHVSDYLHRQSSTADFCLLSANLRNLSSNSSAQLPLLLEPRELEPKFIQYEGLDRAHSACPILAQAPKHSPDLV